MCPEMTKFMHFLCRKCRKSRYFCGRISARFLRSRKVNKVFHVWCWWLNNSIFQSVFNISSAEYISVLKLYLLSQCLLLTLPYNLIKCVANYLPPCPPFVSGSSHGIGHYIYIVSTTCIFRTFFFLSKSGL